MRRGLPAALILLLVVGGEALGAVEEARAETRGLRASGEYLLWWFKEGRVPPLVTAGGSGVPGSADTRILRDDLDFDDDFRSGGRFTLGYDFETIPFAVEAKYVFLSDRRSRDRFSSSGDPVLGRPFLNVATGMSDATLIASPGIAAGSVTLGARTGLWGAEADLTRVGLIGSDELSLALLGGFRFLRFADELAIGERFQVAPDVPGFGGNTVSLEDDFRTTNSFYGGQTGLVSGVRLGRLAIDFRGKIAIGQMHEVAEVSGATHVLGPDGSTTLFQGGLLALRSNIGRHRRDELAFIPEMGLDVALRLTPHLKVYAGYSFLWVSTLARAGRLIDPGVNVSQFPILSGNGPLVGPARPSFHLDGSDFWAQGLSFGLELR